MKDSFIKAQRILRTQNSTMNVIAINGCCYGKENKPDKGSYFKYCGQTFWQFLTDDPNFFLEIIEPLGYQAKEKNETFYIEYGKVINRFTKDFLIDYCFEDGSINWEKIIKINSAENKKIAPN